MQHPLNKTKRRKIEIKKTAVAMIILMLLHTLSLSVVAEKAKSDLQLAESNVPQIENSITGDTANMVVNTESISDASVANSRTTDAMYFEVTDDGVVNFISAS